MATPYDNDRARTERDELKASASGLQNEAKQAKDQVKHEGEVQFAQYRDSAADQVDKVAQSADAAAEAMRQQDDPVGLSHYVADLAGSLGKFAETLRGKSAEDLLHDANRLARENPALFITGSVAIGFGLSRFVKASSNSSQTASSTTPMASKASATSTSSGPSTSDARAPSARYFDDGEPDVDTDASFGTSTRPFDDLDSPNRAPISTEAEQAELPTFNPASKAEREAKTPPNPLYGGGTGKGPNGGLHS